jgi:phosphonoacetaldehyde hydrolase
MIFEAARQMNVYPPSSWVKVDDTLVGIQEGKNAGAWTIGVTKTGNLVGLGENDLKNISSEELNKRMSNAEKEFRSNGADFVIESVAEIFPVINEIEQKIKSGIMPRI